VLGASGSGKSTTLLAHIRRSLAKNDGKILALTPANEQAMRARFGRAFSSEEVQRITVCTPFQFARLHRRVIAELRILDRHEAYEEFEAAAAPLLALEWAPIRSGDIDPEVSGLRFPERFLGAAFTLMMKLLGSDIDPLAISAGALRGTMEFYAHPPNFADPELLRLLKEEHRSSLRVDRAMLDHQRRREIDLTRIVATLFADFAARCEQEHRTTQAGFVRALTAHFASAPAQAEIVRRRYQAVVIDDAQDLSQTDLAWVRAIWGERLVGVMLAGDIHAGMMGFQGARAQLTLSTPEQQLILHERRRGTRQTIAAQQAIYSHPDAPAIPADASDDPASLRIERYPDAKAQAEAIAAYIGDCLQQGIAPGECAVVMRTLRCAKNLIEALLAREIPIDCAGDIDFQHDPTTLDVLALLWAVAAPEQRPDAVLRVLASPLVGLSDRSLALLCAPVEGDRTKAFLENVFLGENDRCLSLLAQERLAKFREEIDRYREALRVRPLRDWLIDLVNESALAAGSSVRARFSRNLLTRVIGEFCLLQAAEPQAELHELLAERERRTRAETNEAHYEQIDFDAVTVAVPAALRGRAFDVVAVADARAGAFPRYYVPDSMLYSPQRGFVPRENAGSTTEARTAKFTWYVAKARVREAYNSEERRCFANLLGRARKRLFVSAWGAATRGKTAPEFLEELRRPNCPPR
jgi:superfamily I DNA/RNA helicase